MHVLDIGARPHYISDDSILVAEENPMIGLASSNMVSNDEIGSQNIFMSRLKRLAKNVMVMILKSGQLNEFAKTRRQLLICKIQSYATAGRVKAKKRKSR